MYIWLVKTGEPVPVDDSHNLMRTGRLASCLENNHKVEWITSSFFHQRKDFFDIPQNYIDKSSNYTIRFFNGCSYKKNISLLRLLNHFQTALNFFIYTIKTKKKPDIIICSFPTIELTFSSYLLSVIFNIPLIIDIRDKWPELFYINKGYFIKKIIKFFIFPYYYLSAISIRKATIVTGVSSEYLRWASKYFNIHKNLANPIEIGYEYNLKPRNNNKEYVSNNIIFWFFGTLGITYNLKNIINAIQSLPKKDKSIIKLIISGDGAELKNLMNINVDYNIEFTGWINQKEKIFYGENSHIGILSYAQNAPQGLPNKLFDYMSFELPVLSSLDGECMRFIRKYDIGWSYDVTNPKCLITEIKDIINNKNRYLKKLKNIQRIKFNFDETRTRKKWENLIDKIKH